MNLLQNFQLAVNAIVGMQTGCSISGHTAIWAQKECFPPPYSTGDTTVDLFSEHNVFSSCIQRYLVSRACD